MDQELQAQFANKKESQLEKKGTETITEACKMGFSTGFEKCKLMAQAFLPCNSAKLLKTDSSNQSLKTVVHDYIGAFLKIF